MQELEKYNPFNIKDYLLLNKNGKKFLIYNNQLIEICPNGYVPKSGLLFDEILTPLICESKSILDLGCGFLGILSLIAIKNNAKKVDAIDYDDNCVQWFNKIIKDNNYLNVRCFKSDYFENVNEKYDIILTNPPQLPMKKGLLHDSGGYDGRQHILEIIEKGHSKLKDDGEMYILIFDFIGVVERTNKAKKSIIELAKEYGYSSSEVVLKVPKIIKKDSITYNNLPYIMSVYPEYNWIQNDKKCYILILRLKK